MTAAHRLAAFRVEPELMDAMERLREKVGISFSEQMRRALRAWLEEQGVLDKTDRKRASTRKRP